MLRPGLVCRHFVEHSFSEMLTVAGQRVVATADSVRGVEHVNEISNGHSWRIGNHRVDGERSFATLHITKDVS